MCRNTGSNSDEHTRHQRVYHDSAAALVQDGRIVAAAQEERFTRRKHDAEFPVHAVRYCLAEGGVEPGSWTPWPSTTSRSTSSRASWKRYLGTAPRGLRRS
jgi:carbamoyltransferase